MTLNWRQGATVDLKAIPVESKAGSLWRLGEEKDGMVSKRNS